MVDVPHCTVVFGSIEPPEADVLDLRVHLGCTKEVSGFELTLQNWNGKYASGGSSPITVGLEGYIAIGRGSNLPQIITCRVENLEFTTPNPQEHYLKVTGRCFGERLFRDVVNAEYLSMKGEEIVVDLMDSYAGLGHARGGVELVEDTSTTYADLAYEDTPLWDVLKYVAETSDLDGVIGYDFRVAPDGKFEFFPVNSKPWAPASLKLYLPFDENTGALARDKSGNGNDGTLVGTLAWVAGYYNYGLFWAPFGSPSGYVVVDDSASLHINSQITICAWVKPTAQGPLNAIVHRAWYGLGAFRFGFEAGHVSFALMNDAGIEEKASLAVSLTLNQWHFVAATYDGAKLLVYVDGVKSSPAVLTGTFSTYDPLVVGSQGGGQFEGTIDEVRVYSEALGEDALLSFYELGPPPLCGMVEVGAYKKDISRIRNRILIYGSADRKLPDDANEDGYTETLDGWTCTPGATPGLALSEEHVHEDGELKYTDSYSIRATDNTDNATVLYAERSLSALSVKGNRGFKNISFWLHWDNPGFCTLTATTVRLCTDASNYYEADILKLVGAKATWQKITVRTDQRPHAAFEQTWTTVGSPSLDNITAIRITLTYSDANLWRRIQIDHLLFSDSRFAAVEEDTNSQNAYGFRELVETDEELVTDEECDLRAKSLLAYYKDPAESITLTTTLLDYGLTPILAGDSVFVALPNEGIYGLYRVDSVEYHVRNDVDMVLEATFELGKTPPILADYLYGIRTKSITIEKLARTKAGRR